MAGCGHLPSDCIVTAKAVVSGAEWLFPKKVGTIKRKSSVFDLSYSTGERYPIEPAHKLKIVRLEVTKM